MNRTYRSVWNETLGAWVAASELASGRVKSSARATRHAAIRLAPHAAAAVLALAIAPSALAAAYTASNEAELATAIASANADGDPSSTITLTSNITIAAPGAVPSATKALTISPGAFVLATAGNGSIDAAAGATVTVDGRITGTGQFNKNGAGTLVLTGTGSSYTNRMVIGAGAVRVQGGGQITFGNAVGNTGLEVSGNNASVTITGAGSLMDARDGASRVGSVAGSSLTVESGGQFRTSNALMLGDTAGTTGRLRVDGAGSLVSINGLSIFRGTGFIDVTAGGKIDSGSFAIGGIGTISAGGTGAVTVTGPGSRLDTGTANLHDGSLAILDGGVVATAYTRIGTTAGQTASTVISGVGSQLVSSSSSAGVDFEIARAGDASLQLANGGTASARAGVGTVKIASAAAARGTLSIGGALGQAAQAPGVLEASSVTLSTGAATIDFNHTDGNYHFAVPILGGSAAAVVSQSGPGTTVLSGANTYAGTTRVAAGTLRAGAAGTLSAASAYTVAAAGTLDLAGFGHTLASVDNAGTVSLVGGAPGTTLTVKGAWVGNGGTLRLGTALGNSASPTDRLVLDGAGAIASGNTQVRIANLGGLGALTTGNGIEVVSAINGATTTAQTTKDAFSLAGGHVDAGAFEYRLHAADAGGAGENWYLRSAVVVAPPVDPGTPPADPGTPGAPGNAPGGAAPAPAPIVIPTYRTEVPLFAALPAQLRQASVSMLGSLHQRIGDDDVKGSAAASEGTARRAWARVLSTDIDIQQSGTVSPTSKGRLTGFQAGTDLLATPNWRAGLYVGQLDGDATVNGFASGVSNLRTGRNDLRNEYVGVYGTFTGDSGFYADAVVQSGRHRYTVQTNIGTGAEGKGNSLLGSIEVGQSFPLGGSGWRIEPQLQLIHQHLDLGNSVILGAVVQPQADSGWIARAGVRVKGEIDTVMGALQPYGRFNVYKTSSGTDIARFVNGATTTDIAAPTGGTSTELAGGFTLALGPTTSLYGEVGKLWSSGGDAKVKSAINGSLGVRVKW
ncbi:autotransporter outer membrane beta-barrel domain-containing protein [Variovorax sp. IB41]|uniref:autotransporter outer membrane beta-barrel domain-containing protein n=1 Tax=Variovorax sp. IB41 TaxID=2779370 RepID=UPI0018E6FFA5|nr:autotransporter outer membrane beta-barrel domain-containing protein [Variovorax sp. IB41]MBJ2157941.1 autotransporter outer membrane beta-barrel domain-containing protein [Variovorax sp. IB41]